MNWKERLLAWKERHPTPAFHMMYGEVINLQEEVNALLDTARSSGALGPWGDDQRSWAKRAEEAQRELQAAIELYLGAGAESASLREETVRHADACWIRARNELAFLAGMR